MRTESLVCFLAIIDAGSFRKAADGLYISQQGLSKVVRGLETELGLPLFDRDSRQTTATQAGLALEPYARQIVALRDELDGAMRKLRLRQARQLTDRLTIMAMPLIVGRTLFHLKQDLADFGLDNIKLVEKSLSKAMQQIRNAPAPELALVDINNDDITGFTQQNPDLAYEPVLRIPLTVLGSRELLAAHAPCINAQEFASIPIAYYDSPMLRNLVERILGADADNVVLQVTNSAMIDAAICDGSAVTISDALSDRFETRRLDAMSIELPWVAPTTIGFLYRVDGDLSDDQQTYIRLFKALIADRYRTYAA
jgi:DNA-binding transcriptional LysR family regulator